MSTREWIADALDVTPAGVLKKLQDAVQHPLACAEVREAPVQEVVHRSNIDLAALLPAPVHNEHDDGAYVTAGLLVSSNPKTGRQNVSINRCQLKGGNRMGVSVLARHRQFPRRHGSRGRAFFRRNRLIMARQYFTAAMPCARAQSI